MTSRTDEAAPARSRVAWNATVGSAAQLVQMATGFLATPIILKHLGDARFGAFAVVASLTTYFGVLDLGIGGSLTRYMTFYSERRMTRVVAAIVTFGVVFYILFGLVLLPLVAWIGGPLAGLVGIDKSVVQSPGLLILSVFGLFIFSSVTGVVNARLAAIHRLDIASTNSMIATVAYALSVVVLTARYPTVEAVLFCSFIQIAVTFVLGVLAVVRHCGVGLMISPFRIPVAQMRELLGFGIWSQINSLSAVINLEADKAIIGGRLGIAQVAPYQVANRLALLSRGLPLQMLSALLPDMTARISRQSGRDEIAAVYRRGSRMLMLSTLLICGFLGGAANSILLLWLSRPLAGASTICIALLTSYAINNLTGLGTTVLNAEGRPRIETIYAVLSATLNTVVTLLLIHPLGLAGVVVGTITGNVVGSLFFLGLFHRISGIGWWWSMGSWLWKLVLATLGSAGVTHLLLAAVTDDSTSRLSLFFAVFGAGVIYMLVFPMLLWLTGFIEDEDRNLLAALGARLRRRRG